jgi:hypothetical protein
MTTAGCQHKGDGSGGKHPGDLSPLHALQTQGPYSCGGLLVTNSYPGYRAMGPRLIISKVLTRIKVVSTVIFNLAYLRSRSVMASEISGLSGCKALIVGTGPSVDKISSIRLLSYDIVILLNHAVMLPCFDSLEATSYSLFFYSGDSLRLQQLSDYLQKRSDIPIVFSPFLLESCRLSPILSCFDNAWILNVRSYNLSALLSVFYDFFFKGHGGWSNPSLPCGLARQVNSYLLDSGAVTASLPAVGGSSALSAILLLAKRGFSQVDLIGCDFSNGRSIELHAKIGGSIFGETDARKRFTLLSEILAEKGVKATNLSWFL